VVGKPSQGLLAQARHSSVSGSSASAGHHERASGNPPNRNSSQQRIWAVGKNFPVQFAEPMKHPPSISGVGGTGAGGATVGVGNPAHGSVQASHASVVGSS